MYIYFFSFGFQYIRTTSPQCWHFSSITTTPKRVSQISQTRFLHCLFGHFIFRISTTSLQKHGGAYWYLPINASPLSLLLPLFILCKLLDAPPSLIRNKETCLSADFLLSFVHCRFSSYVRLSKPLCGTATVISNNYYS